MATYTVELRKLCEIYTRAEVENWFKDYELSDYLLPDQLEVLNKTNIWNKEKLAKKIVDHYYMREIGFETPELFKHYAKLTMNEIMESKLPLIYTTALEYDPLVNVDFTETFNRTTEGEGENKGNSKSDSKNNASGLNINSDTPQGEINKENILKGNYATNTSASETESNITDETNTTSSLTNKNKEEFTRHLKGNQGISATYQAMIKQFRENIVSVDREIINELQTLFMGLY